MYARARRPFGTQEKWRLSSSKNAETGFTLIELLIVIVVLGILAAIVVFSLGGVSADAAVAACKSDAATTEVAVSAYEAQSGGVAPASLDELTQGANPYLQSVPSSSYYAISLDHGDVMVAAPPSAVPVSADAPNACSGASDSGTTSTIPATTTTSTTTIPTTSTTTTSTTTTSTTTIPPTTTTTTLPPTTTTTTTTSTIPPTTTTTIPPTTTTTTTAPKVRTNGVTVTPSSLNYSNYGGQEQLALTNKSAITSLTITVTVVETKGVTYNSESNSFPGGDITESEHTEGGVITYTFDLTHGSIPAKYGGIIYAQFNGDGTVHPFADDTWRVVSTSSGVTSTLSGTF